MSKVKAQNKLRAMVKKVDTKTKMKSDTPRDEMDDQKLSELHYDESAAQQLWRLSKISYCKGSQIKTWSCPTELDDCLFDQFNKFSSTSGNPKQFAINVESVKLFRNKETTNSLVYLGWNLNQKVLGIVFRGTVPSSLKNWITNLKLDKVSPIGHNLACSADGFHDPNKKIQFSEKSLTFEALQSRCEVHRGFQMIMEDLQKFAGLEQGIKDELEKQMDARNDKSTPIIVSVTGHSLGAAMATLYSQVMIKNCNEWKYKQTDNYLCKLESIYVFESPRVGNAEFAELFNALFNANGVKFFRIEKGYDVVVRIPLMQQGYRHVGHQIYYMNFDKDNRVDQSSMSGAMKPKYCGITPFDQYDINGLQVNRDNESGSTSFRGKGEYDNHCNRDNTELTSNPLNRIRDHSNLFNLDEKCQPGRSWLGWVGSFIIDDPDDDEDTTVETPAESDENDKIIDQEYYDVDSQIYW